MTEINTSKMNINWDTLEETHRPLGSSDESYRILLAALDLGWLVEEPVFLRPRWHDSGPWLFHFVIKNDKNQSHLITTFKSPDVERLVIQEGWQVDS